ncbi:MAG: protocatechuate 3,4-dioxygenase subunit alpha [Alphaproteobacteria bacterium]|nr:protocatechuate 3,4-dioxygenase subunit alpha [Alphaproteobacteria bacterium]
MSKLTPTPSQTVGPYYSIGLNWLITTDLARDATTGERIVVSGRLTDGDGAPIPDAVLEVWQADANGRYAHAEDTQDKPKDATFKGFGRVPTDKDGNFVFTTIKPGAVPGPGNSLQAPHILVALSMRGLLRHVYTRIYFSDEAAANATDPILGLIDEPARRATLVAQRAKGAAEYRWDIAMQGTGETVFFDA